MSEFWVYNDRPTQVAAYSWYTIPWKRDCDACVHFVAAPPSQQGQAALLEAVWNHFKHDHNVELMGDRRLLN